MPTLQVQSRPRGWYCSLVPAKHPHTTHVLSTVTIPYRHHPHFGLTVTALMLGEHGRGCGFVSRIPAVLRQCFTNWLFRNPRAFQEGSSATFLRAIREGLPVIQSVVL